MLYGNTIYVPLEKYRRVLHERWDGEKPKSFKVFVRQHKKDIVAHVVSKTGITEKFESKIDTNRWLLVLTFDEVIEFGDYMENLWKIGVSAFGE